MTLLAAVDYARTFVAAVGATPVPIFGHLVLARSVLEACVISAWLDEPALDPVDRVKRGLCEQIYSAMELKRLKVDLERPERLARWKATAAAFGWEVKTERGKPVVDGVKRPSIPEGIDKILMGEGDGEIGRVQWGYLSAVSHVTWYGLRQAIVEQPEAADASGLFIAGVGTTSRSVVTQALCILRTLRNAAAVRFTLMGWIDGEWEAERRRCEVHEAALLEGFQDANM